MKLYGKRSVTERIRINPGSVQKLYLQKKTDLSGIVKEAKKAGLSFESVDKETLLGKCGEAHTQGVMAEVDEYVYTTYAEILKDCVNNAAVPVFLDGITDPQNLGSIIRSLACLGGFALVLAEHGSAQVTEAVLRVASGGENYIRIARVPNIATAVTSAGKKGIRSAGAVVEDGTDILGTVIEYPLALVIGAEDTGIRPGVRKLLDYRVTLPMRGAALSFNAAVAASLFCYEITCRRLCHGRGDSNTEI
ncbi:MAG: RNA methyltransferase [Candidatus Omnitrophota bacterium]